MPLHLLYTFDTSDPAFPLQIPGIRQLPLYYGFPYNAGVCGYRIKSESEIEILHMETKRVEPDFPYENYPATFPAKRMRLVPISKTHHEKLASYIKAEEEGLGDLTLSNVDRKLIFDEFRYPFTQLGGIHRMWQGTPADPCPNRLCEHRLVRRRPCLMDVFAVVWNQPHQGVFLWDRDPRCEAQLIFQVCPICSSIFARNSCT